MIQLQNNQFFKMWIKYLLILSLIIFFSTGAYCNKLKDNKLPALYQITEPVDHAEGPLWDHRTQMLYFVDIHSGGILSWSYETGETSSVNLNGQVTVVTQSKCDPSLFFAGVNRSVVAINWDGKGPIKSKTVLATVSNQFPTSRFNDGKADKQGRLWWGTMGYEDASGHLTPNEALLYKITKDNLKNPEVMVAPVNISNGIAWNKDNNKMYFVDTPSRKIAEFDYDDHLGSISNRKVAFDLEKYPQIAGSPDGMTIDKDDNLWIALYGGGSVIKVNPSKGTLLQRISIPATFVTSTMWGGPNFDTLFVTSSRYTMNQDQRKSQPSAGAVFAITNSGTSGFPVFEADICSPAKTKRCVRKRSN